MGILDDYLNSSDNNTVTAPSKPSSVINQYMSASEEKPARLYVSPKPPISDIPNYQPETTVQGGSNPKSVLDIPTNAGAAIADTAKQGVSQIGQGLSETFTNQPATGVGNIGTGLAALATSPVAAINSVSGDVLGSPNQDVPRYPSGSPTGQPPLANPPTPANPAPIKTKSIMMITPK